MGVQLMEPGYYREMGISALEALLKPPTAFPDFTRIPPGSGSRSCVHHVQFGTGLVSPVWRRIDAEQIPLRTWSITLGMQVTGLRACGAARDGGHGADAITRTAQRELAARISHGTSAATHSSTKRAGWIIHASPSRQTSQASSNCRHSRPPGINRHFNVQKAPAPDVDRSETGHR